MHPNWDTLIVDLDGTLLNKEGEISERNLRAFKEVREQGIEIIIATGRCYLCSEAGDFRSNTPPILAGLASDVAIHGHLHAGTAALECALSGIPTLLINREGVRDSMLDQLGLGEVIFSDWDSAFDALIKYFKNLRL